MGKDKTPKVPKKPRFNVFDKELKDLTPDDARKALLRMTKEHEAKNDGTAR